MTILPSSEPSVGTISSLSPHGTANTKTSPNATASARRADVPAELLGQRVVLRTVARTTQHDLVPHAGKHPRAAAADPAGADDSDPHDAEAYVTVSVPCMPACLCESTGQ